jgi:hypothetical protein
MLEHADEDGNQDSYGKDVKIDHLFHIVSSPNILDKQARKSYFIILYYISRNSLCKMKKNLQL